MYNQKSLYRKHLEESGFASTRAMDLDDAIKRLHMAICQVDSSSPQDLALNGLLDKSMRDIVSEFGTIEELRKSF